MQEVSHWHRQQVMLLLKLSTRSEYLSAQFLKPPFRPELQRLVGSFQVPTFLTRFLKNMAQDPLPLLLPDPPLFATDELNDAVSSLLTMSPSVQKLIQKMDDSAQEGWTLDEFTALFVDTFKEDYGAPFINDFIDICNLLFEIKLSDDSKWRITTVVNDAIHDLFVPLMAGLFATLCQDEGCLANKKTVLASAALISLAGDAPVEWATAVRMFFAAVQCESQGGEFQLEDALRFTRQMCEMVDVALKRVIKRALSFQMAFTGHIADQLDEAFSSLDDDRNESLSVAEIMAPMLKAHAEAVNMHKEVMMNESEDVSKVGGLYTSLAVFLEELTSDYTLYETEVELFEAAIAPVDGTQYLPLIFFKFRLLKDAILGRLAILAIENGGDQEVSRMEFIHIALSTATPLIRELLRPGPGVDEAAVELLGAEDKVDPNADFYERVKAAVDHHVRNRGLDALLGSIFDLFDVDSSGTLSLEEIVNARIFFKGAGGPNVEERLSALIGVFDKDKDGELSKSEVKLAFAKILSVLRKVGYLLIDIGTASVFNGALEPMITTFWDEVFPKKCHVSSELLKEGLVHLGELEPLIDLHHHYRSAQSLEDDQVPFSVEEAVEMTRHKPRTPSPTPNSSAC